jgi:hypothetical protein
MPRTTGTRIRGSKGVSKPKTGMGMDAEQTNPFAETGWDMFDLFSKLMGVEGGGEGGVTDAPKGGTPVDNTVAGGSPLPFMDALPGMPQPSSGMGRGAQLVGKGGHVRTPSGMPAAEGEFGAGQLDALGGMANDVAGWDPFKGTVPYVGGNTEPPPMPMRKPGPPGGIGRPPGTTPGPRIPGTAPVAAAAPPPMPQMGPIGQEQGQINREQALINQGQGEWGHTPMPMTKDPAADATEQGLIAQGQGQFGYGQGSIPMGQPTVDALSKFFQMMAGGL